MNEDRPVLSLVSDSKIPLNVFFNIMFLALICCRFLW